MNASIHILLSGKQLNAKVRQHLSQQIQGQAHHVKVVPLDPGDKQRRLPLSAVGPRLSKGFLSE